MIVDKTKPILHINARFDECGEWGGHREHLQIFSSIHHFKLRYDIYSADCDSLHVFENRPIEQFVSSQEIILGEEEQKAILAFAHEMVDKKKSFKAFPYHACIGLSIWDTDSTFYIRACDWSPEPYLKLLKQLNLTGKN